MKHAVLALLIWSTATTAMAQTSDAALDGHYESTWEWGPWPEHTGLALGCFGGVYVLQVVSTAVSAAQGEHDVGLSYSASRLDEYRQWGYLPIVGPWAKLALAPPHVSDDGALLFAVEGLLELASITFFVVSLFGHERTEWVSDRTAGSWRITPRATGVSFDLAF